MVRMRRGEARGRIVEAARELCAREGVGATSIRGVVRASGTNLNAVHYHFGSRDNLIEQLVDDALSALNGERFASFDELDAPTPREVLRAGYGPLFRQALGPDAGRYRSGLSIVGQLRFDPTGAGHRAMNARNAAFVERIEGLLKACTSHSGGRLRTRMQLINESAWDSALRPDVLARLENRSDRPGALRRFVNDFLDFAEAGLITP